MVAMTKSAIHIETDQPGRHLPGRRRKQESGADPYCDRAEILAHERGFARVELENFIHYRRKIRQHEIVMSRSDPGRLYQK